MVACRTQVYGALGDRSGPFGAFAVGTTDMSDGVVIRHAATRELDDACAVLGLAFMENPSTLANVGGDRVRAQRLIRSTARAVKLATPYSHVLVAETDGRIVGVLNAVAWPHCQLGLADKVKTAPRLILAVGTAVGSAAKMASARARHDPDRPHLHIGPVGVHPEHQGHGIGSTLLGTFLDSADHEGQSSFLETDVDQNVRLYERFGFVVTSREEILGIDTRFMSRTPRPSIGEP
jgi:ribosomal protein S18 acetylase RimI-like enzyme